MRNFRRYIAKLEIFENLLCIFENLKIATMILCNEIKPFCQNKFIQNCLQSNKRFSNIIV